MVELIITTAATGLIVRPNCAATDTKAPIFTGDKLIVLAIGTRTFITAIAGALPEPVSSAKVKGKIILANLASIARLASVLVSNSINPLALIPSVKIVATITIEIMLL